MIKNQNDDFLAKCEKNFLFLSLYGSWKSEKTGDELADEVYVSRADRPREVKTYW